MTTQNGNSPAYPVPFGVTSRVGLTKRELFAAMAMQGILASPDIVTAYNQERFIKGDVGTIFERVSQASISYADALLAELEKKQ